MFCSTMQFPLSPAPSSTLHRVARTAFLATDERKGERNSVQFSKCCQHCTNNKRNAIANEVQSSPPTSNANRVHAEDGNFPIARTACVHKMKLFCCSVGCTQLNMCGFCGRTSNDNFYVKLKNQQPAHSIWICSR